MAIRFCKGIKEEFDIKNGLKLDNNFFKKANRLFLEKNIEYIPIIDNNGKYICCCYNDKKLDTYLDKLITISNSKFGKEELKKHFSRINIISFNEFGYKLYLELIKLNCKVGLTGELWDNFNCKSDYINDCNLICLEGNMGLTLDECGIWKNVLPHNEYEFINKIYQKSIRNYKLYDKKVENKNNTNRLIKKLIKSNKPFMAARLGNTEAILTNEYLFGNYQKLWISFLYTISGFYSQKKYSKDINEIMDFNDIELYCKKTLDAIKNCDVHLCRFEGEIAVLNNYSSEESIFTDWYHLYTGFDKNCWLSALKNKKVLIISSFNDSIKHQYNIKESINKGVLPNMNIEYYTPYQTYVGNYNIDNSWFDNLDKMIEDIKKIDFDIALIACGAYGYLLASVIKDMGKQSIELCSGLYPIFGIKNKTQIIIRKVSSMYDKNWIFPIEEKPSNYMDVDKGSYWD